MSASMITAGTSSGVYTTPAFWGRFSRLSGIQFVVSSTIACWKGIARYLLRRAAIASLRELDDRALRDIGLVRSQIEAAAHGLMTAPNRARK